VLRRYSQFIHNGQPDYKFGALLSTAVNPDIAAMRKGDLVRDSQP
jgi:hypothetical protein